MFVNNKKSIFDKIDDKEIDINIETEQTARDNEYVSEIMDIKNRNKYLFRRNGWPPTILLIRNVYVKKFRYYFFCTGWSDT